MAEAQTQGDAGRRRAAELKAAGVVFTTLVAGTELLVAPGRLGVVFGVGDEPGLRIVGAVDLVIAAGILFSPRRSRWLYARAAANPPTALYFQKLGAASGRRAPGLIGLVICALSLQDISAARELARGE